MEDITWSQEEFGSAELGDARRTQRAVLIALRLCERRHGLVSKAIPKDAEREGAYRFLENDKVSVEALGRARAVACARRMEAVGGIIIVPVDQTSLRLHDHTGKAGFGSVGTRKGKAQGIHVDTALALTEQGVPLGILDQQYFVRSKQRSPIRKPGSRQTRHDPRPREQRESQHMLDTLDRALSVAREHAPSAVPWFQVDRGGDSWLVFDWAVKNQALMTVRLAQNRNVLDERGRKMPLRNWLRRRSICSFEREVEVPTPDGKTRTATLKVRYGTTQLVVKLGRNRWHLIPVTIVDARELRPPRGQAPLHWTLGTTYQVNSQEDAERVIDNYVLRWRIEEFHRAWKSGACNIEKSQLRSPDAFVKWAIFLASMTARAEHLKNLSRDSPDAPANVAFSQDEIDLMITWRHTQVPKAHTPYQVGDVPPLQAVVLWVALLGGYNGPRGRPKPGTVVIARGLELLEAMLLGARVARLLEHRRSG
jgi:hypothetical protein